MAFVAFHEFGSAAAAKATASPASDSDVANPSRLSALEWSVIAIARGDRLSSLRRPGRLAVALRTLFNQHNPMLADERLEALRRVAVLTWHYGYTIPSSEVRRFLKAGFNLDQYELMVDSIGAARNSVKRGIA